MKKKHKVLVICLLVLAIFLAAGIYLSHSNVEVLNPKGPIALKERNLIYAVLLLSLFVVIPVFTATILIAVRYRASNKKHVVYAPEWDHSRRLETLWWAFPTLLILILSIVTWRSTHALAPYVPISSSNPRMTIQVVALDWKWLFIYPQQHIASVDYVAMPVNTPVDFVITADAPMNSFWIPQLGGQIYAMAGMETQLNLMASQAGNFRGSSANISGAGFSDMTFIAHAGSDSSFNTWVHSVQQSRNSLTAASYNQLARPSVNGPATSYKLADDNLFNAIINKYMMPGVSQT